jgi:hypothetical protein
MIRMSLKASDVTQRKSVTPGSIAYVLVLAGCVALMHPLVNTGVSDDFSFIKTAKDFADTGRIVYNGWSSPFLGWMIPFGALFIKLFGFSFIAARAATFVIAIVNGILLQWILLRAGCSRVLALFGATAVLLSPICLPFAVVFFTDGPGLLTFLVTLALCIRAVRAETSRATEFWIATAFCASLLLGTARQLLWMCALVMVPSAVWLVRKRKGVVPWSAACFVLMAACMAAVLHWWKQQPYALVEPLLTHVPLASWSRYVILPGIELVVLLAPALSLFLTRRVSRSVYALCAALALVSALALMHNPFNLLDTASHDIFGDAPPWVCLLSLAYSFGLLPIAVHTAYHALRGRVPLTGRGEISFHELSVLLLPFSCALFLVADSRENFFARYLLPVMAALTMWMVKLWSDLRARRSGCGIIAPVVTAIYCAFIVIQMHDLFLNTAAVLSLSKWSVAQGMPRDQIEEGFSFDGWYQIQQTGYINEPRIKVPAGAYVKHDLPPYLRACHNFFLPDTPSIHPMYGVGETLSPCFTGPILHAVEYTAWMAPHRRTVFIARYAPQYALPAH